MGVGISKTLLIELQITDESCDTFENMLKHIIKSAGGAGFKQGKKREMIDLAEGMLEQIQNPGEYEQEKEQL